MSVSIRSVISTAASKIGLGLCYGIGFGMSAGFILQYITMSGVLDDWDGRTAEALKITAHNKTERNGDVVILGSLINMTKDPVSLAFVQVDLLDKAGALVDQCRESLLGTVPAEAERKFMVSCGGTPTQPTVAHDSYKVYVIGR